MKSLSCSCLAQRTSMEAPIPSRQIGFDTNTSTTARPRGLVRKNSKLQTHVEVLRCKLGKPTGNSTEVNQIFGPSKHWTPIYYAVHHQRESALIHFLRAGGSPDVVDNVGVPPLCIAAANGSIEIVRILLEAGADVNAQVKESGETALHIAIKQSRTDIIDLLLQYDPSLESHTTGTGETPLHYAASKSGSLATVVNLLKQGSRYDTLNAKGQSPAEAALSANNIQAAVAIINSARGSRNKLAKEKELLLKHVEKNQNKFSIGNELIADIFAAACDPDSTVLVEAIKRNDASLVELFLEKGADPDRETAKGLRPIFVALECANASVIQVLVKHNVDVTTRDANGLTVLQAAFEGPNAQDKEAISAIFDCLLERGANAKVTYPDGKTLLHRAISPTFGHIRVALLLLRHGVKANAKDNEGNTALHLATHNKSCIDILLKNGAKAGQSNADDLTPLLYAMGITQRTNEPDFDTLIKASDLRRTNSLGQTALHLAASNGLEKTIHHLLRARAETMIVDMKKNTPLLLAVLGHQWHIVPLLTMPPSTNSWDEAGLTALHHIASSTPKGSSTWKDIAIAAVPFCQRGTSRSMRDRSGATPLILATKTLPEEGLPLIETLLMQAADRRMNWNCVGHEDHDGRDALFYAITLGKSSFVEALLKAGATFSFKDWLPNKRAVNIPAQADKQITKALTQYEWSRRAGALRRQSAGLDSEVTESPFVTMFPLKDIKHMISMGLAPNALPKTSLGSSLMWAILRQVPLQPPLSPKYLYDSIKLILEYRADPNIGTARGGRRTPSPQASTQDLPLSLHTLTFLLEEYPSVEADLVTLLLLKGTKLSIASPFYNGRFPLHSATKANRMDLVDEFLLRRAEVDCQDREGRTPLFIAAEKGYWEIAEALLRRSASVTIKDNEKTTVLHAAAAGGSKRVISILLRAGAKAGVKNGKGLKPLDCIPQELEAKEKEKLTTLLQDWEEVEQRNTERERKAVEQTAIQEAKTRLRKEEEAKAKLRREAEAKATMLKAQEESEKKLREQRAKEQEKSRKTEVSVPPPAKEKVKSSFFRPSLLSSRKSVSPAPVAAPTMPKMLLDVQIHTTELTNRNKPTEPISSPAPKAITTPTTPLVGTSSTKTVPNPPNITPTVAIAEKRNASPRIDSGFGQKRAVDTGKPLPVLDRSKTTLEADDNKKRNSSAAELADWLALSKMMDRL